MNEPTKKSTTDTTDQKRAEDLVSDHFVDVTEPTVKEAEPETIAPLAYEGLTFPVGERAELEINGLPDDIDRLDGLARAQVHLTTPDGQEHRLSPGQVTKPGHRLVVFTPTKPGLHRFAWRVEKRSAAYVESIPAPSGEFMALAPASPQLTSTMKRSA